MNDEPPVITDAPAPPRKSVSQVPVLLGVLVGALPWLLSLLPMKNYGALPFLILACFGMPVISLVIALIPKSRRFGLGLLLATGLGWLVLGAICGGLLR